MDNIRKGRSLSRFVLLLSLLLLITTVGFSGVLAQEECPLAPATPEDRRPNPDVLVVVTFNAEWLFDGVNDPRAPWQSEEEADAHLEAVASVIRELDADIVNLVEVEDCSILKELIGLLPDSGYNPYLIKGKDTYTGQDVAILTRVDPQVDLQRSEERVRYPVAGSTYSGVPGGTQGVSKHYWTYFNINGIPITLVGLHFLAFPTQPDRIVKREAQAAVIQHIVEEDALNKGREVIVLGDFNDYGNLPDSARHSPNSIVLRTVRDADPDVEGDELFNTAALIPQEERYSDWYDRDGDGMDDGGDEHSLIDHILVSKGLRDGVENVEIYHTYDPAVVSDHWPIVVTFDLSSVTHEGEAECLELKEEIENLKTQLGQKEGDIENLQAQLKQKGEDIGSLQAKLGQTEERVSTLEAELNEVQQRNQGLLTELEECKQGPTNGKILISQYILYLLVALVVALLIMTIYFALRRAR